MTEVVKSFSLRGSIVCKTSLTLLVVAHMQGYQNTCSLRKVDEKGALSEDFGARSTGGGNAVDRLLWRTPPQGGGEPVEKG